VRNILSALVVLVFIFNFNCGNTRDDASSEVAFENIIEAAPLAAKLLFNNNYVTVIEFDLKSGARLPTFTLGDFTLYSLSDCEIGYLDDSRAATKEFQSGDIFWHRAGRQVMGNKGTENARFFIVARKTTVLPEYVLEDLDRDVSQTAPKVAELLLDNDNIRVIEVNLRPGEEIKTHRGIARIVYSLNLYTINYTSDEYNFDSTVKKIFEPGYTHWHESASHSLVNIGETPLRELIFEFKK